jgi:hypothetical protein
MFIWPLNAGMSCCTGNTDHVRFIVGGQERYVVVSRDSFVVTSTTWAFP